MSATVSWHSDWGNLRWSQWLAIRKACEARLPWRISRCSREKPCFHHLAARHGGDRSGGGADRKSSRRWLAQGLPGRVCRRRPGPATPLTSAPGVAIIVAAVAPPRQPPLPALSAPGLRLPPPRTVATTITTGAPRPITAAVRSITRGPLLRQSAVLRWRIWLSPVQRPLFQRSSGRRLVIAAIANRFNPPLPRCGRRISSFCDNWQPALTRWPRVWISFKG